VIRSARRSLAPLGATLAVALVCSTGGQARATRAIGFSAPQYVDTTLAGGEPFVIADAAHGTLVYTSHEGTTHLYRNGLVSSPFGDFQFVSNYCNQVNVWTSTDHGLTWQRDRYLSSPCPTSPALNTGFSDPDLTIDASGRMYDTGIDLVNDAIFSSGDGGRTWDKGTPQCHDGDRPWLAGGVANEVFMSTDTVEGTLSHQIFQSTDGGATCSSTGIPDAGTLDGHGSYSGFGKLYFDSGKKRLVEPVVFGDGVGVGTWKRGDAAFTPHFVAKTSLFSHWPAIALDSANTIYLVWDTAPTKADGSPLPNAVYYAFSKDFGSTWSSPLRVASPSNALVFWPWVVAGSQGRISIVWYQTNPGEVVNIDSTPAHVSIREETILGASSGTRTVYGPVDPAGRPIHVGSVCQGGTTCVATGQDRRLGDFFTNATDAAGCVLIASGDTRLVDPLTGADYPTSRPIFIRQTSGPSLRSSGSCG